MNGRYNWIDQGGEVGGSCEYKNSGGRDISRRGDWVSVKRAGAILRGLLVRLGQQE